MSKAVYRQGNIELLRFIVSIIIMTFHASYIGIERGEFPFSESYIYVEFFFAIMGYFTVVHFDKTSHTSLDDKAKASISYTVKKVLSFWPYTFICQTLYYLVERSPFTNQYEFEDVIQYFFDITLLTGCFNDKKALNGVLWFLSAMLVVYPVFSLLCQMKSKHFFAILSFYIPLLYYGYFNEIEYTRFPMNALRAFAGLFLGGAVYCIATKMRELKLSMCARIVSTVMEIGIFAFVLFATYKSKDYYRLYICCFIIGLGLMLSGQSYTSLIRGKILDWLGRISLTIYIFHPLVGISIMHFLPDISVNQRVVLYYAGTVLISSLLYCVIESRRKNIFILKK